MPTSAAGLGGPRSARLAWAMQLPRVSPHNAAAWATAAGLFAAWQYYDARKAEAARAAAAVPTMSADELRTWNADKLKAAGSGTKDASS